MAAVSKTTVTRKIKHLQNLQKRFSVLFYM